jgi:hypothetical protein
MRKYLCRDRFAPLNGLDKPRNCGPASNCQNTATTFVSSIAHGPFTTYPIEAHSLVSRCALTNFSI